MLRLLFITLLSVSPLVCLPQSPTFFRSYGGVYHEFGRWLVETPDSGFAIAGTSQTFSNGVYDIYVVRTNKYGDTLWTKHYGGVGNEQCASIEITADSGFIIAGTTMSFGTGTPNSSNWYLIRTDQNGDTLWTKTYGNYNNDVLYHALPTSDGGFLLMGYMDIGGWAKGTIIKVNSTGYPLWTDYVGSSGNSYAFESIESSNGDYICTSSALSGTFNALFQRINSSGTVMLTKSYHSSGQYADAGISIVPAHNGGYMVLGLYGNYGSYNVWMLRLNDNLDTLWTKKFQSLLQNQQVWQKDASITKVDGGYVLCGTALSAGTMDLRMVKVDTLGNILWTQNHIGAGEQYGYKAISTRDGGIAACGIAYDSSYIADFLLVRTDSAGNIAPSSPPSASAGPGGQVCFGDTFFLNASSASNSNTLRWYSSGTGQFSDTTMLHPYYVPSASDASTGTVLLTLKAIALGYPAVLSTCTLIVSSLPVVSLSGLDSSYCLNAPPASAIGLPTGGIYSGTGVSSLGVFSPAFAGLGIHSVSYLYTDPSSNCSNADTLQISVNPSPIVNIINSGPSIFCPGDSSQLIADFDPSWNYQWLMNGSLIAGAMDTILVVSDSGLYQVIVMNSFGCADTSNFESIQLHSLPEPDLGADTSLCADHTLMLDGGNGFSAYLWSTGNSTQTIFFDSTGIGIGDFIIWVEVGNQDGCFGIDSIKVEFVDCTGFDKLEMGTTLVVYPNPFSQNLNLVVPEEYNFPMEISIFSPLGQVVFHDIITEIHEEISLVFNQSFHLGVYLIRLSDQDGKTMYRTVLHR